MTVNNEPYICKRCGRNRAYWFWNIDRDEDGNEIQWKANMVICRFCGQRDFPTNFKYVYKPIKIENKK